MDGANNGRVILSVEDRIRLMLGDSLIRAVAAETRCIELAAQVEEQAKEITALNVKLAGAAPRESASPEETP